MRPRSTNLRNKVIALLASLVALWAFAAWVTLREGVNLLGVQTINSQIVLPSEPLLLELQVERRHAVAYLGGPTTARREAFEAASSAVDRNTNSFKAAARSWKARLAGDADTERHVDATIAALDGLSNVRKSIGDRSVDRAAAATSYSTVIESLFQLYNVVGSIDDPEIKEDGQHLIELYRVRELISQEDALLSGALAAGRITPGEYLQFTQLASVQQYLADQVEVKLREPDRTLFRQLIAGESIADLRRVEQQVISADREQTRIAVTAAEWDRVSDAALTEMQDMVLDSGHALVDRSTPVAIGVIVRLFLAAGLGLLAVIASIVVSITTARALVAQLQRLRDAAHQLAEERLPRVVARLRGGEQVDVSAEAPPLDFGDDEIGQVGQAFNRVQETAIRTAVEQAELRRNVREVFLNLARRTQALVHRQVTLLDDMQRQEEDPDTLEGLYGVDHLATRMRRNAENLIVLSGAKPGRAWRKSVPMIDVVRGAIQEVEDYRRVDVRHVGSVSLAGRSVSDVIHLLAELIENALSFSPPHTRVNVKGQLVGNGYVIEIEDRGLGMSQEDLAAANAQINSQEEFNLANASRLGLFVVSSLIHRHGIHVQLTESPYGGTTAVVLIPTDLVTEVSDNELPAASRVGGRVSAATRRSDDGAQAGGNALPASAIGLADPPAPAADRQRARSGRARKDLSPSVEPAPTATGVRASANPATPPATSHTPGGLPLRVRQASLAQQLRDSTGARTGAGSDDEDAPRPPEEVRKMMSSYQSGTQRGRTDATRLLDDESGQASDPGGGPNDVPAADE
ncbi:nitrate- and nitrite sensing domain-containing protein [Micromonospora sp. WMMA1363]|uniref:sensor histidine kinase n=1 Tax=Micromonospora sp. WMMA1363 TaxID=3053985 RepID=UPI00259CC0DA|nr:nitrate- and nitrite sensing domain-containing protein [Micromonospora sp. WMMA1363]MDM4719182.1 nitrate- and nitrite sensing domain-containing protein [Micromonospora sp. WMMA1363]